MTDLICRVKREKKSEVSMNKVGVLIRHKTKANQRGLAQEIWQKHMPEAVGANRAHLKYFYCQNENQANEICAFQVYENIQAAQDFLKTPAYLAYQAEVEPHIEEAPEVTILKILWEK